MTEAISAGPVGSQNWPFLCKGQAWAQPRFGSPDLFFQSPNPTRTITRDLRRTTYYSGRLSANRPELTPPDSLSTPFSNSSCPLVGRTSDLILPVPNLRRCGVSTPRARNSRKLLWSPDTSKTEEPAGSRATFESFDNQFSFHLERQRTDDRLGRIWSLFGLHPLQRLERNEP
jgi:hypothetical protein